MPKRQTAPSQARPQETVDQLVYRWDAGNRSGNTGFGPVAWSCGDEQVRTLRGLARVLQVKGEVTAPGLVRRVNNGKVALARRVLGHDPGGRPGTVCHVLFGTEQNLGVETCLGLRRWDWPGADLDLDEVRGPLERVPADGLLRTAAPELDALTRELERVEGPLSAAVAAVLRDPGGRHSFRAGRDSGGGGGDGSGDGGGGDRDGGDGGGGDGGGDLPHLVLWGLYGLFGALPAQPHLGWSYATHDNDDSVPNQFTFVPRWPTDASHDEDRVRTDLRRPRQDRELDVASALVRIHLATAARAVGGKGGAGGGAGCAPVAATLAREAEAAGIDDLHSAGDSLLRAAERAVESFQSSRVSRAPKSPSAHGTSARSKPPLERRPRTGLRGPRLGMTDPRDGAGRGPEQPAAPRRGQAPRQGRAAGQGREPGREPGQAPGRGSGDAGWDARRLANLREDVTYEDAHRILRDVLTRAANWPPALREELCTIAVGRSLFLHLPRSSGRWSDEDTDTRVAHAAEVYDKAVRPLAQQHAVRQQLASLLPELCVSTDTANRETARRILGGDRPSGLPEDVWRAVFRALDADRRPPPPAPEPEPEREREREPLRAPEPRPAAEPAPARPPSRPDPARAVPPDPVFADEQRSADGYEDGHDGGYDGGYSDHYGTPHDRSFDRPADQPADRPRSRPRGAHARPDSGRSALARFGAGLGFRVGGADEHPGTRTHLAPDDTSPGGPDTGSADRHEQLFLWVVGTGLLTVLAVVCVVVYFGARLWS